jgi:hypothetical protein
VKRLLGAEGAENANVEVIGQMVAGKPETRGSLVEGA